MMKDSMHMHVVSGGVVFVCFFFVSIAPICSCGCLLACYAQCYSSRYAYTSLFLYIVAVEVHDPRSS